MKGRLWWIFMVGASLVNWVCCLFVAPEGPIANRDTELSAIDEEEEPPPENWEYDDEDEARSTRKEAEDDVFGGDLPLKPSPGGSPLKNGYVPDTTKIDSPV